VKETTIPNVIWRRRTHDIKDNVKQFHPSASILLTWRISLIRLCFNDIQVATAYFMTRCMELR
jgi:hypothetical protein